MEISDSEPCDSKKTKVKFLNETFSHNLKNLDWGFGGRKKNAVKDKHEIEYREKKLMHFWEIQAISILLYGTKLTFF